MSMTSRSLRRHQDINTMVHNVMPPSGLHLRLRRSLDHAKGGKLQQHGNWGIYHFAFSISPQDYGFDKQDLNLIVRGPPEHYGMHIICNNIVVFMLICALCAHVRLCLILLSLCWFVTWVREHNCVPAMLECSSPVYGKHKKTRTKCSRHTLWQIYTLISENMYHPLWNMGMVAKVLEK